MMLFSDGAPLTPTGGSSCNLEIQSGNFQSWTLRSPRRPSRTPTNSIPFILRHKLTKSISLLLCWAGTNHKNYINQVITLQSICKFKVLKDHASSNIKIIFSSRINVYSMTILLKQKKFKTSTAKNIFIEPSICKDCVLITAAGANCYQKGGRRGGRQTVVYTLMTKKHIQFN